MQGGVPLEAFATYAPLTATVISFYVSKLWFLNSQALNVFFANNLTSLLFVSNEPYVFAQHLY